MTTASVPGRPLVGVLALQGAFAEHRAALAAVGAEPVDIRGAERLDALDGLVLPGGESSTVGLVAGASGMLGALRRRIVEDGLPTLGTCAGMIMLARATTGGPQPLIGGMDIVVRRNAYGRQRASFEAPVEVPLLGPPPMTAVFIRAPWVEEAGPEVEPLAVLGGRPVLVRQGNMVVCAFHPELTGDLRLHAWFVDWVRARRDGRAETRGGARVRAQ